MDLHRYAFRSRWLLDATPEETYRALLVVEDYPLWWPQVRRVTALDADTYAMVVRSLLPYDLTFRSTRAVEDPERGVLEARMSGDLDGFSRWRISAAPAGGTELVFEEEVVAGKPLLRRLALVARPAFRANHALMMRAGRTGLREYLRTGRT